MCREGYLWNSGNFLFLAQTLLTEYALREAATVAAVKQAVADAVVDLGFVRLDAAAFAKTRKALDRLCRDGEDDQGGGGSGLFRLVRCRLLECGARSVAAGRGRQCGAGRGGLRQCAAAISSPPSASSSAVVGLDDLAVIATGDAILVARREDAAGVKALVERLKKTNEKLTQDHLQSFRPWGNYRSLDLGQRHQVKSIVVKPGGRLSLQKHHHRSEHWIVVRGTATVTVAGQVKTVHENESVYIPIGAVHRMENPGKIDLEIIEVQTGGYFGEDDIIRLEDVYNRAAS